MEISKVILIGKTQESYAFFPHVSDKLAFFLIPVNDTSFFP